MNYKTYILLLSWTVYFFAMQPHALEIELFAAVVCNADVKIKKLIEEENVNINARDYSGRTAVFIAASDVKTRALKELLRHNPDVNLSDNHGWTPLQKAAKTGYFELAQLLVSAGANVDQADGEGYTPLVRAYRQPTIAQLLIDRGAGVNHQALDGKTVLLCAACEDRLEMLQLLVSEGAQDTFRSNQTARNARDIARSHVAAAYTNQSQACADFLEYACGKNRIP